MGPNDLEAELVGMVSIYVQLEKKKIPSRVRVFH